MMQCGMGGGMMGMAPPMGFGGLAGMPGGAQGGAMGSSAPPPPPAPGVGGLMLPAMPGAGGGPPLGGMMMPCAMPGMGGFPGFPGGFPGTMPGGMQGSMPGMGGAGGCGGMPPGIPAPPPPPGAPGPSGGGVGLAQQGILAPFGQTSSGPLGEDQAGGAGGMAGMMSGMMRGMMPTMTPSPIMMIGMMMCQMAMMMKAAQAAGGSGGSESGQDGAAAAPNPMMGMMAGNPMFGANPMMAGMMGGGSAPSSAPAAPAPPSKVGEDGIDPDVRELGDYFNIEDRWIRRLNETMKKRMHTKEEDLAKLYEVLERARSPTGLLTVKIGEMECGQFVGKIKPDKDVERLARKFNLDDHVTSRLTELVVRRRATKEEDLERIEQHLRYCKRPSAMATLLAGKLLEGEVDELPDLEEAEEIMSKYKLDEDARSKLREIVEKRASERKEVLAMVRKHLDTSANASSMLCKIARPLIDGERLPDPPERSRKQSAGDGAGAGSDNRDRGRGDRDRGDRERRDRSRDRDRDRRKGRSRSRGDRGDRH